MKIYSADGGTFATNESGAKELFYRATGRRTPKSETKLIAVVLFYSACGYSVEKPVVGLKENRTHRPVYPSSTLRVFNAKRVTLFTGESKPPMKHNQFS